MACAARERRARDTAVDGSARFPLSPGVVVGIGLGRFVDGIVLHQILQWHHMLTSAGYPPAAGYVLAARDQRREEARIRRAA